MVKRQHTNNLLYLFILTFSLFLMGCWSYRELNTKALIAGIAIDKAQNPELIEVTAQIIKPGMMKTAQQKSSSEGGTTTGKPVWNIKGEGRTVFETLRKATHISNRKLFIAHNRILIFSESLAREGIKKHLDFFIRDHESYPTIWIIISQKKASALLDTTTQLGNVPAFSLAESIEDERATSQAPIVDLHDFSKKLLNKTACPIAPLATVINVGQDKYAKFGGTAIFKGDNVVGKLNNRETRGMLWVINKVKSGIIVVNCADGKASLEIMSAQSKIEPQIIDNKLHLTIQIKETSALGEYGCNEDLFSPANIKKMEDQQNLIIYNEIKDVITKAQELNTDIFDFGAAFQRKYPKLWKSLEDNWDEYFPQIEISIQVTSKLKRTGLSKFIP